VRKNRGTNVTLPPAYIIKTICSSKHIVFIRILPSSYIIWDLPEYSRKSELPGEKERAGISGKTRVSVFPTNRIK
jgi:hypothetical protein